MCKYPLHDSLEVHLFKRACVTSETILSKSLINYSSTFPLNKFESYIPTYYKRVIGWCLIPLDFKIQCSFSLASNPNQFYWFG